MHPITAALLAWYDRSARTLPWRGIHDPYRTWVSEAMLQQTRVETVLSYYGRFLSRFPDLPSLAAAEEADVLKLWEGLGYYSRARNLLKGARMVMENCGGQRPADPERLRAICGIGPYMAGAIASIAYDIPVPAVDGNVIRVVSRLYGIREDASSSAVRRNIESLAASLIPAERPGDHNQAVMDLGATVCVPGTPDFADQALTGVWSGTSEELLALCQKLERAAGRPKKHSSRESRTLDCDIILFGDAVSDAPELTLPHPRAKRRRFVLEPLAEIAPEWLFPDSGTTVLHELDSLDD